MKQKTTVVEIPKGLHAKVKIYCGRMGFKIKAFVSRVLEDAITKDKSV